MKDRHGKITRTLFVHSVLVESGCYEFVYFVILPKADIYRACDIARDMFTKEHSTTGLIQTVVTRITEELRCIDYTDFRRSSGLMEKKEVYRLTAETI